MSLQARRNPTRAHPRGPSPRYRIGDPVTWRLDRGEPRHLGAIIAAHVDSRVAWYDVIGNDGKPWMLAEHALERS